MRVKVFTSYIEEIQKDKESEEYKKYGKHMFSLYNSNDTSVEEKRETILEMKNFFTN